MMAPQPMTADVLRASTEMEQHGQALASTARRLAMIADSLEERINAFMNNPSALGAGKNAETPPEPNPGTLSGIRYFHTKIDSTMERLDGAMGQLRGII